jgi:hypothetical protein
MSFHSSHKPEMGKKSHVNVTERCIASQFFDLIFKFFSFAAFLLFAYRLENGGVALRKVVEFVIRAFLEVVRGFDDFHDSDLQHFEQPAQRRDFLFVGQFHARPALLANIAFGIVRDLPQSVQVPGVFRVVDGLGQLLISFLLLRLVREAVGVKQLHQLPPELAHFGGFLGGEFLLFRQRRRRLRIFLLMLRARLPVFLRDLPGRFLALPHQRFQILPAIADDQPQPVAPLEMLAQPGKQPRLHRLHLRLFDET